MKKTLTLLAIMLVSILGMSQVSVGLKLTGLSTNMAMKDNVEMLSSLARTQYTISPGLTVEYDVNPKLSIVSGVNYTPRQFDLGMSQTLNLGALPIKIGAEVQYQTRSLEIPVEVKYDFYQNNGLSLWGSAGAIASQTLKAELRPYISEPIRLALPRVGVSTDQINATTVLATMGIGADYATNGGKLIGRLGFQKNLSNVIPETIVPINAKNYGFSVSIGYAMSI